MKTSETLNDILKQKAEAELLGKLNSLFNPLTDFAYDGLHSGRMDHAPKDKLSGGGYFVVQNDVWPPHMLAQAKAALFEGMKRDYADRHIHNFITKVESLGNQIEALQQEIQQ
jgi:hypothetical protein